MPNDARMEKLIVLLIRKTKEGQIKWEAATPPGTLTEGTDQKIVDYLETTFKEQRIAVFERRFRAYDGENDNHYWADKDCMGFVNGSRFTKSITWETSDYPALLYSLLTSAKESAAEVDNILDSLLD